MQGRADFFVKLYVGLTASCLLFIVAALLVRRTKRHRDDLDLELDAAGVLQLTWLLGNEPRLLQVDQPGLDTLRAAGMYEIDPKAIRSRNLRLSPHVEKEQLIRERDLSFEHTL